MFTAEDIAAIPLFSGLPSSDHERVAQSAADVHLRPGEYAVHEGEERALFAVISGKIEVTKRMEGAEKSIGWRLPGTIFGEVPITLGASFPGSFRASEATRVLRIDARQYYVIAAAAPGVAVAVGALARERLGGLQGLAAKAPIPQVTVVGHRWDPACHDLRRFMETYGQELGYSVAQVAMRAGHDPSVAARHYSGRMHETDRQLAAAVATLLIPPGES